MKFSEQWLREWIDLPVDRDTLMSQLTMAGLEVDGCEPVAAGFEGVVVAEILSVDRHPEADKLSLCRVSDGGEEVQIVCGAPGLFVGMKAPLARIGASLPAPDAEDGKPFRIRKAKLRGVESQGMLCSPAELGLSEDSSGLMQLPADAPVGNDLREYLALDDVAIELDLTPNRGDCLGMLGLARETAVLNGMEFRAPEFSAVEVRCDTSLPVRIEAADGCPQYLGRVIEGIDPDAETPVWMQEKLRRSGLRSIDPLVDVTNFVLLELGQPMHAFDLAQLEGGIVVRYAETGEKLTLLDGREIVLENSHLLICDEKKPVALAGIMGGEGSSVSSDTRSVFLECACFAPLAIAGRARAFGLHTDSSHRFERGVDHALQAQAMERATALILEIAGGRAGPVVEATGDVPELARITLRFCSVERLLGMALPAAKIEAILTRLGCRIVSRDEEQLQVEAPSFRYDLAIEADLIEELARVHGYDNIPGRHSAIRTRLGQASESRLGADRLRDHLVAAGYQEVITYSFVAPELLGRIQPEPAPVPLQNPISADMAVMRTSLWPGLLETLQYNLNRQQGRVRLFETGQVFLKEGRTLSQPPCLAGLVYGTRYPQDWNQGRDKVDFFDIKGDVEALTGMTRRPEDFRFRPSQHPALHPGQSAEVLDGDVSIGMVGRLHPQLQRELDVPGPVFLFQLRLQPLQQSSVATFVPLSRYPAVSRDLAVVIGESVPTGDLVRQLRETAGEYLVDLRIFDVYQGDAIGQGEKSVALGLTWQHPSRTLGDEDVNVIFSNCVNDLEQTFKARLRD
ncbi:MAG: phenylalanine--tRNA ligase subunit beta [Pseudohongiellaceae bacterium]